MVNFDCFFMFTANKNKGAKTAHILSPLFGGLTENNPHNKRLMFDAEQQSVLFSILPARTHFLSFLNLLYFVHNGLSKLPQLAVQRDGCGVQRWVFTVGGQFQIIVSPGAVANQFLFPQSQATSWRFGTTAHLGLVSAKDIRSTELGSEEKRGAPPPSAAPASQPEPGGF